MKKKLLLTTLATAAFATVLMVQGGMVSPRVKDRVASKRVRVETPRTLANPFVTEQTRMRLPRTALPQLRTAAETEFSATYYNFYDIMYGNFSTRDEGCTTLKTYDSGDIADLYGIDSSKSVYAGDDKILFQSWWDTSFIISATTGEEIGTYPTHTAYSWSYDYNDKKIYGCFTDDSSYMFGAIDPSSGSYEPAKIASCDMYIAMGVAKDGKVYALKSDGNIFVLDKSTGEAELLGNPSLTYYLVDDYNYGIPVIMFYDWDADILYLSACTDDFWYNSTLWAISTTDGSASKQNEWQMTILTGVYKSYTPGDAEVVAAPKGAEGVAAVFENGALTGSVNFTAPTENIKGEAGSGALSYSVKCGADEVANGTCEWGAEVSVPITLEAAGNYYFSVTMSNDGGNSAVASTSTMWVGNDTPVAPSNVRLKISNQVATLTWDAVETGVHSGYVDAGQIKYNVYDNGGNMVAEALTTTTWEKELTMPESPETLKYSVKASFGDLLSDGADSNNAVNGYYEVPFVRDFNTQDTAFKDFSFFDFTPDNPYYGWTWDNGALYLNNAVDSNRDAWAITPPIKLNQGVEYTFKIDVKPNTRQSESFAIYMLEGTDYANPVATIIEPTTTNGDYNNYETCKFTFKAPVTGTFTFGIHCTTAIRGGGIHFDNLTLKDASDYAAPAAITDLTAVADSKGELSATLSFTVPTVDINGDPIPYISGYEIYRNGKSLHYCNESRESGKQEVYVDEDFTEIGQYEYEVITWINSRVSEGAKASTFVGVNAPGAVTGLTIAEPDYDGKVTLSWTAPTLDVNGDALNGDAVKYNVYVYDPATQDWVSVAEKLELPSYEYQAVDAGTQRFMQWAVRAVTSGGEGTAAISDLRVVGEPYQNPFNESFADGQTAHSYAAAVLAGEPSLILGDDAGTYSDIKSQDGDNGYLILQGSSGQTGGEDAIGINFGRFRVPEENAALTFYYHPLESPSNTNIIAVAINDGGEHDNIVAYVYQNEPHSWQRCMIDLSEYAGKVVEVKVQMRVNSIYQYVFFDNFTFGSLPSKDVAFESLLVPAKITAGETATFTANVVNNGFEDAEGYKVNLYCNGDAVCTIEGEKIPAGQKGAVVLSYTPGILADEALVLKADVQYEGDVTPDDNESGEIETSLVMPEWPVVDDLAAHVEEYDVKLEWSKPEGENVEASTDDVEGYESWLTADCGDWTMVDLDGHAKLGYLYGNIPVAGKPVGFFVFDDTENSDSYKAHSGNKYFAALSQNRGTGANDAWLISPVLDGTAQTIEFWVSNLFEAYTDSFEIWYSSSDRNPDNFTKLQEYKITGAKWINVTQKLPEGALFFAIRSTSDNQSMLKVDDIKFRAGAKTVNDLLGYNVYRNGLLANESLLEEPTFGDVLASADAENNYVVTVKYSKGESAPSNEVTARFVSGVNGDGLSAQVAVGTDKGGVIVTGAENHLVYVASADGKVVFSGAGRDRMRIDTGAGVFMVKIGNRTFKVNVP